MIRYCQWKLKKPDSNSLSSSKGNSPNSFNLLLSWYHIFCKKSTTSVSERLFFVFSPICFAFFHSPYFFPSTLAESSAFPFVFPDRIRFYVLYHFIQKSFYFHVFRALFSFSLSQFYFSDQIVFCCPSKVSAAKKSAGYADIPERVWYNNPIGSANLHHLIPHSQNSTERMNAF